MKMRKIEIGQIEGFRLGNAEDREAATGCTVIICEEGAVAGVDVRGGAPATRETDLLRSENTVGEINAVVLSGGSAFGLESASGVMRFLAANGIGFKVGEIAVPIVCGASLYDLAVGSPDIFPDVEMGKQACRNAYRGIFTNGNSGAGTGASCGKISGMGRAMKTGLGTYAIGDDYIRVGAVTAVNAVGDIYDGAGKIIAGLRNISGDSIKGTVRSYRDKVHSEYKEEWNRQSLRHRKASKKLSADVSEMSDIAAAMKMAFESARQIQIEKKVTLEDVQEKSSPAHSSEPSSESVSEKDYRSNAGRTSTESESHEYYSRHAMTYPSDTDQQDESAAAVSERYTPDDSGSAQTDAAAANSQADTASVSADETVALPHNSDASVYSASVLTDDSTPEQAEEPDTGDTSELAAAADAGTDNAGDIVPAEEADTDNADEIAAEKEPDKYAAGEITAAEEADTDAADETAAVEEADEYAAGEITAAEEADTDAADETAAADESDTDNTDRIVSTEESDADEYTGMFETEPQPYVSKSTPLSSLPTIEIISKEELLKNNSRQYSEPDAYDLELGLYPDEYEGDDDDLDLGYDIPFNTVISCVITNAKLTKPQANKLAAILHDAYARAIRPSHTTMDGDTIFVMATGKQEVEFDAFAALATDVLQYAIIDAANSADGAYGLPSAADMTDRENRDE